MADLAKLLVEEGVLTPEAVVRAAGWSRTVDVASAALQLELASETELARVLGVAHGCPGVDLSRSVVPTRHLDTVAPEFCAEHGLLPVEVGRGEVLLAMADPEDLGAADEVRFLTGKRVLRCVAVPSALAKAIEGVARARAEARPAWRGARAQPLADPGLAHAAIVQPQRRAAAAAVELPEVTTGSMELIGVAEALGAFAPRGRFDEEELPARPAPAAPGEAAPGGVPLMGARPPPPATPPAPGEPAPMPERVTLRMSGVAVGKVAVVADDDLAVRQLVAMVLRKLGCLVLEAADGPSALEQVREARPDLVVLDAMMPGLHGFEVCRAIKGDRVLRSARVILCSAIYRGTVGVDAQVAFGADGFLEKPFRLEELTRACKLALVGHAAAESPEERAARAQSQALWRSAADALAGGRATQAAELAREAASKDPWSAEAHYYLGHALARQNLFLEAVAAYERSAELRPDVDATHQCLAQTYEKLGFQKSAREAWGRAIETCKDAARRKAMQARLLALLGG